MIKDQELPYKLICKYLGQTKPVFPLTLMILIFSAFPKVYFAVLLDKHF